MINFLVLVSALILPSYGLNPDGFFLLSLKDSILSDPLKVLETWNYNDRTPCSWNGVTCADIGVPASPDRFRVTGLALPGSQLLGSIPQQLGFIQYLRQLDLSNNFLNGSIPASIFNSSELQMISLSGNKISGELPELHSESLQVLNVSDNALAGKIPQNLSGLKNLTVLSLRANYFSGSVPSSFESIEVLDLSSNLLNGSLPLDFDGVNLHYLNLSYNKISGLIFPSFAKKIPGNATIDLSFNNLTGPIPESVSLLNQKTESFVGNIDLCGKPLKNLCSIPSSLSTPPNASSISPAIAVIPKPTETSPLNSTGSQNNGTQNQSQSGLKPGTIVAISVADLAGIAILALVILYVYKCRTRKSAINQSTSSKTVTSHTSNKDELEQTEQKPKPTTCSCLKSKGDQETSDATTSSDSEQDEQQAQAATAEEETQKQNKEGKLMMVDGETELEMETLLKASAYILGANTGGSIVYKAVLGDGAAFAVRRVGESCVLERFKDFENQVRFIAKFRHHNLVKIRGFYWADDEKLVINDYVSNGSLATFSYRKPGASPSNLPLEVRFKIARGVARGLAYIHDKKHVHANIKPSNILLNHDMEPVISDFGLDRLVKGTSTLKSGSSSRQFGSQRSMQDQVIASSPAASSTPGSTVSLSPYQAPESLKNLKPNPKWDVYSFGIILLELLTGRVFTERELNQYWTGSIMDDKNKILRLADVAVRAELEAKEESVLACFKLGFSCASFLPQKRSSMREAVQVLEKIPYNTNSSFSFRY